ncbi:MAG: putative Ig domain-containing protein [Bacteroidota bacterium]
MKNSILFFRSLSIMLAMVCGISFSVAQLQGNFSPSDKFPSAGKYMSAPGATASSPERILLRNIVMRGLSHVASPPALGASQPYDFSCVCDFELSTDGGTTFSNQTVPGTCSVNLLHSRDSASVRFFDTEMLTLNLSGGTLPAGIMLRESPTLQSTGSTTINSTTGGFKIDSFFDVFFEVSLDGGGTWSAESSLRITLSEPAEYSYLTATYPPPGKYVSDPLDVITMTNGMKMRNINHHGFSVSTATPAVGITQTYSFTGACSFDFSSDGGSSWVPVQGQTSDGISLTHHDNDGTTSFFDTEMLQLDITGLPGSMMVRESPTKQSLGRLSVSTVGDGSYRISSFFDVFTELSLDGGATWSPSTKSVAVNLGVQCATLTALPALLPNGAEGTAYNQSLTGSGGFAPYGFVISGGALPPGMTLSGAGTISGAPTSSGIYNFTVTITDVNGCSSTQGFTITVYPPQALTMSAEFPPVGKYKSLPETLVTYPNGVQFKNVVIRDLSHVGQPPSLGSIQTYPFNCTVDLQVSTDGGSTFTNSTASGPCIILLSHASDVGPDSFFNTEMLSLNLSGGTLPAGIMIRESPTKQSLGREIITPSGGEFHISSFFDIFTELSLDGGTTWTPSAASLPVELTTPDENTFNTDFFPPPGSWISPLGAPVSWGKGMMMRNIHLENFSVSNPEPARGATQQFPFNGDFNFELSTDGGQNWSSVHAQSVDVVNVFHHDDDVIASFFDTEILQMNITGLPGGIIIRESPTKASTGRTCSVPSSGNFRISSFFDVFTELSLDGGATWMPSAGSITLSLTLNCPTITINPPSLPSAVNGSAYNQNVSASGGTPPYSYSISSGSLPSGISPSSGGVLSGTLTHAGIYNFTVMAQDADGCIGTQEYSITIYGTPSFSASAKFPPAGKFNSYPGDVAMCSNNIQIRNLVLRGLSHVGSPPSLGAVQGYDFSCALDFDLSTDGGSTFTSSTASGASSVSISHSSDNGSTQYFDTEMLSLNVTTGGVGAVMVRESPSKASLGKTTIVPDPRGYRISSFFDVFLELSMDGGATWSPAANALPMQGVCPDEHVFASNTLPPGGNLTGSPGTVIVYPGGNEIRNLVLHSFSSAAPPPDLGLSLTHSYNCVCDLDFSSDGGSTWVTVHGQCSNADSIEHHDDDGTASFFDTEMLQMDLTVSGPPASIMVRESPSKHSLGRSSIRPINGGYRVSSFFDVFTELSLDGGSTWSPSTTPPAAMQFVESQDTIQALLKHGWNMVSVPVIVSDFTEIDIYGLAVSRAFEYQGTYKSDSLLANNIGYWVKFAAMEIQPITGSPITLDTINVVTGWNMIGSISYPVAAADVIPNPPSLTTSKFFTYENGYVVKDTVQPGYGYWVKASQNGQLIFSTGDGFAKTAARLKIIESDEMPPPPPHEVTGNTVEIPKMYSLGQNYPNPFNPTTTFKYTLPGDSYVRVVIYDVLGQTVKTLVDQVQPAGYKSISWDANAVSSGLYFYRLEATSVNDPSIKFMQIRKMLLIK